MTRVEKTKQYLDMLFDNSEHLREHPYEKSYRYEHTLRVATWGRRIATAEGLNWEALVVGCLLHDVAYIDNLDTKEKQIGHGRRSALIVREFVSSLGFDSDDEKSILYGIAAHVDGNAGFDGKTTVLAESISDADNLDRFDVYRIYESLEYEAFKEMSLDDKIEYCEKRIAACNRNMEVEFATEYATHVFREELITMRDFFARMRDQLRGSIWE